MTNEINLSVLENQKRLNNILDFYIEHQIPIKVVKCQYEITSGKRKRFGRFNLNKDNHIFLTKNNGYYLFLVELDKKLIKGKVILAKDIKFHKLIVWKFLLL